MSSRIRKHIKSKSREADFRQIYTASYDKAYKVAYYICKNEEDAKDILSEFYSKLWSKNMDYSTVENLENYLLISVRNHTLNFLKKNKAKLYQELTEQIESTIREDRTAVDDICTAETKKEIISAIEELPEKRKHIFKLSRFEDKTTQEIASANNISIKTVEDHIRKSLLFLHRRFPDIHRA